MAVLPVPPRPTTVNRRRFSSRMKSATRAGFDGAILKIGGRQRRRRIDELRARRPAHGPLRLALAGETAFDARRGLLRRLGRVGKHRLLPGNRLLQL